MAREPTKSERLLGYLSGGSERMSPFARSSVAVDGIQREIILPAYTRLPSDEASASALPCQTTALEIVSGDSHQNGASSPKQRKSSKSVDSAAVQVEVQEDSVAYSNPTSSCRFVDNLWFNTVMLLVLTANTVMVAYEMVDPSSSKFVSAPDQAILGFYMFELCCKICFYGSYFLCGPTTFVIWSVLDVAVVAAGGCQHALAVYMENGANITKDMLRAHVSLRVVRLLQLFKMLKLLLRYDFTWADSAAFQSFIGGVIAFNSLLMGLETDIDWHGWFLIEQVLLGIYSFELLVRLKKFGVCGFLSWSNGDFCWNWLDFTIVVSSGIDSWLLPLSRLVIKALFTDLEESTHGTSATKKKSGGINLSQVMMLMRMLRLMRILRLVKLVKAVEPLYILVVGISAAVQGVIWVLILTIVIIYAMAIIATRLIGHGLVFEGQSSQPDPENLSVFGNVPVSMFTLFRVMSGAQSDDEAYKMDGLMASLPSMKFAFVFFMVTSSWTLLSILTAVVSENMISTCSDQQAEMCMLSDEEDRLSHMANLRELFDELDVNDNGSLDKQELNAVLNEKEMAQKIAHICRVPARNVREVFTTLTRHGESCSIDHFVESMIEVAKPATEQSVMKILAHIFDTTATVQSQAPKVDTSIRKMLDTLDEKEQVHAEAILAIERSNAETMSQISSALSSLSKRQDDMEAMNATRISSLTARVDSLESMAIEASQKLDLQ